MTVRSSEMVEDGLECPSDEGGYYIGKVHIPPPPPIIGQKNMKGQSRLIIHSIEMNNFKSYTGTEILGPFCKSFNAIIGPNGSGKSNVIDAMLFVFGTKSSQIRGTNNHSLIHYSKQAGSVDDCFVTVQFVEIIDKDGDKYEIKENSEIRITRRAYRYKTISFYFINEQSVRFKDIEKLLRSHGIDLTYNRFLILQGQVEQISQLPPKARNPKEQGLLEYLEEIIGTNRYNTPFNLLRQEIENNELAKESHLAKVNAAKENVESLASELAKCLDYFKKENTVISMQHQISQVHLADLQRQAKQSAKKRDEKEAQTVELKRRVLEVCEAIDEKQNELNAIDQRLSEFRQAVQGNEDALAENLAKIAKFEASNKEIERKNCKYKSEQNSLVKKEKEAKNLIPRNKKSIEVLEEQIVELDETVKEEEKRLEEMVVTIADATKDLKEKKDELQKQQMELSRKYDKAKSEYQLNESQLSVFTSTEVEHTGKLAKLRASMEETTRQYKEYQERMAHLQASLPSLESESAQCAAQLHRTNEREAQIDQAMRKYQTEAAELSDRVQKSTTRNQLIDFVMKLKSSGSVSGILGRLGDLGAIDEQYDVAVSTSCGSSLDHIVCETVESGQAVLAQVKRANVGRVFIMALDQMDQYRRYTGPVKSTPGNLPRLFDLIRVEDERVKTAMYYATHNTLVAPTLEKAMQVGYANNVRVVTLEGAIIEPSGIMSGGGRTLIRGKMGRSVQVTTDPNTAAQRNKILRKIQNLEADLSNLQSTKGNLQKTLAELKMKITVENRELQRLSIDIPSLEHQIPTIQEQIRVLESGLNQVKLDPKQLKKLTDDVRKKKLAMNKCGEESKKLEDKVASVHEEIMEVSSGKTRDIKKSLSEAQRKLNKAKSDLNNMRVEIKRAERDLITCAQRATDLMEEMQSLGLKHVNNDEHIGIYKEQNAALKLEIDNKKAEIQNISPQGKNIMQEMSKLTAWHDKEVALLETVDRELKTIRRTHEELLKGVKHAEDSLKEYELKPLPVVYDLDEVFAQAANFELKPDITDELVLLSSEELERVDIDGLETQIRKIDNELKFMDFNESRVADYKKEISEYAKKARDMQSILANLSMYSVGYEQCMARRQKEFDTNFMKISRRVQECYQMLTFGGKAELEYEEYSDPYAKGIKYVVRPLRKTWKNIDCLSGGEKTLASLALVFAFHYYAPSPLYFLDEIDAALDVRNVAIIGHFIRTRTRFAQFIIISLRDEMFELASTLIGIWKINDCTHTVTVNESICQKDQQETVQNDDLDLDESDEEEDEEQESQDETGTMETEQTIPTPVGPGTGVPGSGDETELDTEVETELDDANTEPDEPLNGIQTEDEDEGRSGRKDGGKRSAFRSGRKRKENVVSEDESDVDDVTNVRGKRNRYGELKNEEKKGGSVVPSRMESVSKRLRVRGVQQINEGPLSPPVGQRLSALQEFIQKQRRSEKARAREDKDNGDVRDRVKRREKVGQNVGSRRELTEGPGNDTGDEYSPDMADDNVSDNTADEALSRSRRGRPLKTFVPNTEDENSDEESQVSEDASDGGDIHLNETMRMDDTNNVDLVPKKRGRSKKSVTGLGIEEKRGKRKVTTVSGDELSQDEDVPRRVSQKRGRKPKTRVDDNIVDDAEMSQEEEPPEREPKKKRGRKAKPKIDYNTEDDEVLSQDEDVQSQEEEDIDEMPKKKRGRKAKPKIDYNIEDEVLSQDEDVQSQAEEDIDERLPKKKRGRKAKPKIDYNTEDDGVLSKDEDVQSQAEEDINERVPKKRRGRKAKPKIDYNTEDEVLSQDEDVQSQEEEDVDERVPKKKRGRKAKPKIDYHTEDDEDVQSQAEEDIDERVSKKKRGRKSKPKIDYNTEDDEVLSQAEEDIDERVPKKKRGRKAKPKIDPSHVESDADAEMSQEEDVEETVDKRRRGRKRKR